MAHIVHYTGYSCAMNGAHNVIRKFSFFLSSAVIHTLRSVSLSLSVSLYSDVVIGTQTRSVRIKTYSVCCNIGASERLLVAQMGEGANVGWVDR